MYQRAEIWQGKIERTGELVNSYPPRLNAWGSIYISLTFVFRLSNHRPPPMLTPLWRGGAFRLGFTCIPACQKSTDHSSVDVTTCRFNLGVDRSRITSMGMSGIVWIWKTVCQRGCSKCGNTHTHPWRPLIHSLPQNNPAPDLVYCTKNKHTLY